MWRNVSDATTRAATRRLFALYLLISGIALAFPHRPDSWPLLALLHLAAITLLLYPQALRGFTARFPRAARVLADWYLLALIPALYTELATLNVAVFNGRYFDSLIIGAEQRVFGTQPSHELAHALPYLPLSEFLHFSYISYYLIIYVPAIYLYARGRHEAFRQLVFNLMLAFFAHYVFFIYFPVQGPRYMFAAPDGPIARGYFYQLAHRILEAGSSRGAAFPSSHVGVSAAQTAFAFLTIPALAPGVLLLSLGLALGAVYGGFHYATDAIVGALYGLLLFWLAPRVAARFGK